MAPRHRLLGLLFFMFIVFPAVVYGIELIVNIGGGVEFNLVSVWVPSKLYGQLGVFALPLNVSDQGLISYNNMYIVDEKGQPYYSYLFSNTPPLAVWVDPAVSTKTYSVFYGGNNPYSSYIATPGGSVPLFAAYDDFDYDSGLWTHTGGFMISESQAYLTNGTMMLSSSYTPGVYALWLVRFGSYGTMIQLYSPTGYAGWVYLRLDASNFKDWESIRDGADIYFTDKDGHPLNYTVAYLDKTIPRADLFFYVNISAGQSETVYMYYGRDNPYPEYRTPLTHRIVAVDITPKPRPTAYTKTAYQITGYAPPQSSEAVLELRNVTINANDVIAPHLYDWYFDGVDDYIVYDGYDFPQVNFTDVFTVIVNFRDVDNTAWKKLVSFSYGGAYYGLGQFGEGGSNDYYAQVSNGTLSFQSIGYGGDVGNPLNWGLQGLYTVGWSYNASYGKITGYRYFDGFTAESTVPYNDLAGGFTQVWIAKPGYWHGYVGYIILKKAWKAWNINPLDSSAIVLIDPTFFNGTHYVDIVSGALGTPYDVKRVEADEKWLWIVKSVADDGLVHLKYFPAGSVVRFIDVATNRTAAVVYINGLVNGAGLVPDVALPLPSGVYNVVVDTYVFAGGAGESRDTSVLTGLSVYTGSWPSPVARDEALKTADGGTIYFEYAGTGYVVAWYQPSPYTSSRTDYVTDEAGWKPFPYMNDYSSTTGTRLLYADTGPIVLEANITVDGNKITIAPHLFNWYFDGVDDYIVFNTPIGISIDKITVWTRAKVLTWKVSGGFWSWWGVGKDVDGDGVSDGPFNFFDAGPYNDGVRLPESFGNVTRLSTFIYTFDPSTAYEYHDYLVVWSVANFTRWSYIDGNLVNYVDSPLFNPLNASTDVFVPVNRLRIGKHDYPMHAVESYLVVWRDLVTDPGHVVSGNVWLLLDPTFFNGTYYFDLISGVTGTPYGGVGRIPADEKWLWVVVNNTAADNTVSFKWFPENTIVVIKNATTGEVVASFGVPPGEAGITVALDPGSYTVEAIIYPPGSYRRVAASDVSIGANDVIAPHLYKAYIEGGSETGSNFIYLGDVAPYNGSYTMVMWAKGYPSDAAVASMFYPLDSNTGYFLVELDQQGYLSAAGRDPVTNEYYAHPNRTAVSSSSAEFALSYDYSTGTAYYIDADEQVSVTSTQHGFGYKIYLGRDVDWDDPNVDARSQDPSEWGYFILYTRLVDATDILRSHVVDDPGFVFFFDATWFNGTDYLGLEGGVYTVTGRVDRVLDSEYWLWRVAGLASDGYVHFRFFPYGTIIRLYDAKGNLRYVFYIDGTPNDAGLVEDYKASIASGTYTVEALIPLWDENPASCVSVSYQNSRDGYSAELSDTAVFDPVGNGLFNVSVLLTPSMQGIDKASGAPTAFYAWGPAPVYNIPVAPSVPGIGTVFEARLNATDYWSIGVLNMSSPGSRLLPWIGDLSTVLMVYGYNGSVYMYYSPDNKLVNTTLTYTPNTWIYVYVELRPDGAIVVGVGPGVYASNGIYENVATYTYTPTNWKPMYVTFGAGLLVREAGAHMLYIDWIRVRPSTTSRFTASSATGQMVYAEEKRLEYLDTAANHTLYLDMSDMSGFELTLYGRNGTYRIVYGTPYTSVAGPSYSYVVSGPSDVLRLYNGTALLASASLTHPVAGRLAVSYNTSHITVGLLDGNKYTLLISYRVNDTLYRLADLVALKYTATDSIEPVYTADTVAGYNLVESVSQTIVPTAPGSTEAYKLGFRYNTTINNETYTAEWGVLINGTDVSLYIDENGTVKTVLGIGTAKTPLLVGVGYSFENATDRLSVYSMIVWTETGNGTVVTKYLTRYVDVDMKTAVAWAVPFAEAINSSLIIDRFGLTLGWAMGQIIRGNILATISGYYPVGGLIKYVTISSPIKIKIENGNIVTEPATSGTGTIVLEGFQGWTLSLALYGASVSEITITSNEYPIEFPTGFTAVIVADISARKISIVSAEAPGIIHEGEIAQGQSLAPAIIAHPKYTVIYDPATVVNSIILAATLAGVAIASNRLTGNVGDGLTIAGFVAVVVLLLLGDYVNMSIAIIIAVIGIAVKKAYQS